ncbi:MAG: hypothetical protein DMG79_01655 [Acidobacteria bacterium]|nr:MAG: hypothetical protein DMG79_01655 [Acidobacteriota bacterium]
MTIDPEQERARLTESYSHQTDGELEQIATQSDGLSDVAIEALRSEMAKRGLTQDLLIEEPDADVIEPEFRNLIVVRSFWNLLEAELAKGALDAAGIECFLFDDNMIRMDWFNANAIGGVKLRVDPQNADAANQILDECAANVPVADEPDSGA